MIIIEKNKDYPHGGMRPFVTVCKRRTIGDHPLQNSPRGECAMVVFGGLLVYGFSNECHYIRKRYFCVVKRPFLQLEIGTFGSQKGLFCFSCDG